MNDSQIKDRVLALQQALGQHKAADPALLDLLRDLERDIRQALERAPESTAEPRSPDLSSQLLAIEAKLESEHPLLLSTLRDASDTLGKMGL